MGVENGEEDPFEEEKEGLYVNAINHGS